MSLSLFIISHHQLNGFCHYGLENPLGVIFLVRAAMLSLLVNLQKSQGEFTVAFFVCINLFLERGRYPNRRFCLIMLSSERTK
jgi:hypothetical protein